MTDGWHVGHARILDCLERLCNIHSWRTVVIWKKKGFPLRYNHRNKPYIIESEVVEFIMKHREK